MPARALITGGAGGLGRTMARILLDRGWSVIIVDRDRAALDAAREWLDAGDALGCAALDIADADGWQALGAATGPVDFLINNACPPSVRQPLLSIAVDDWRAMLDVGVTGAFFAIRTIVPAMVGRGRGTVLNIASMAALGPVPRHGDYAAAKSALLSLTENLRAELRDIGVSVSAACPGAIGWRGGEGGGPAAPIAPGRMDPATGMTHVIDRALAGEFLIATHADGIDAAMARCRAIADAFDRAPDARNGANS